MPQQPGLVLVPEKAQERQAPGMARAMGQALREPAQAQAGRQREQAPGSVLLLALLRVQPHRP